MLSASALLCESRATFDTKKGRPEFTGRPCDSVLVPSLFRSSLRRSDTKRFGFCLLLLDHAVAFACDVTEPSNGATRTRRNETTDDYVLLQAFERVHAAVDGCIRQHACRLLE